MIAELQTEKERLDEAILALERLSTLTFGDAAGHLAVPKTSGCGRTVEAETEAKAE